MRSRAAFRGQPLLLLAGLLAGWFALRVSTWQPLFALPAAPSYFLADAAPSLAQVPVRLPGGETMASVAPAIAAAPAVIRLALAQVAGPAQPALAPVVAAGRSASPALASARFAVGHNLLLAAGLAQMELPGALLAYLDAPAPGAGVPAAAPPLVAPPAPAPVQSRWSADGWMFLREDAGGPLIPGQPSYGRSQAGGVLRYALAPASGHRPQAYARASSALTGPRDEELAAGLSARPLPGIPLRVAAEARVNRTALGTEVRPSAYAVTELPPFRLPMGAQGEAYLQGGYVGGRFATAFVDGQGRVDRTVARLGEVELRAGAGAWGGAQKGAARLDVGPTAALTFRLGEGRGRVAADYRFRVAGDAAPASGPALTVSAGF